MVSQVAEMRQMTVNVHLVWDARKWQTQQGEDRYENRVAITNIARWE